MIKSEWRTSKKVRYCYFCGRTIAVGHKYYHTFIVKDPELSIKPQSTSSCTNMDCALEPLHHD